MSLASKTTSPSQNAAVGDSHHQSAHDHPLHLDLVADELVCRQDLAGELYLTDGQRAAAAFTAGPSEEEADKLPERIHAKASRHHRIAFEMAGEEPQVGFQVEFRNNMSLAVRSAVTRISVIRSHISIGGIGN